MGLSPVVFLWVLPLPHPGSLVSSFSPRLLLTVLEAWGFCRPVQHAGSPLWRREVARWLETWAC